MQQLPWRHQLRLLERYLQKQILLEVAYGTHVDYARSIVSMIENSIKNEKQKRGAQNPYVCTPSILSSD